MTMSAEKVLIAAAVAALPATAIASETITCTYDARDPLVKVMRTGDGDDRAGNRTNLNLASPNPTPP